MSVDGHADRDQLAASLIGWGMHPHQAGMLSGLIAPSQWLKSHDWVVRRAALLEAADKIQALHPGERKASVELLQDMARAEAGT